VAPGSPIHPSSHLAPPRVSDFASARSSVEALGEPSDKAEVPIEHSAAGIESNYLDAAHPLSPQPEPCTRAAGTMKLPAINLSRSSSLDRQIARNA
jgi:hypothetical protein